MLVEPFDFEMNSESDADFEYKQFLRQLQTDG